MITKDRILAELEKEVVYDADGSIILQEDFGAIADRIANLINEQAIHVLKLAYHWGRDNGSSRSEKNFNDFLQTTTVKKFLNQ